MTSVCMEEILTYLNAVRIRCTYKAVGEAIGVSPQSVGRYLGTRRKRASWVVSAKTGEPTGYTPAEKHPRLKENKHIIRSGTVLINAVRDGQRQILQLPDEPEAAAGPKRI